MYRILFVQKCKEKKLIGLYIIRNINNYYKYKIIDKGDCILNL